MHNATRLLSAALAASALAIALPAVADDGSSSSSVSSSSSSDAARVERCARFSRPSDYARCVRLIRRVPEREGASSSAQSSSDDGSGLDWKWKNILGRMEAKVESMVKFSSVMAKKFCRAQTDNDESTSQECMLRMKNEMQARVSKLIDEAFRAPLPSAR
jgi:hypothetical protein